MQKGASSELKSFFLMSKNLKKGDTCLISFVDIRKMEKESRGLELLATIDPLTKIYNQMKFGSMMEAEMAKSKKTKKPLSLVAMDIDFFKKINDTYGYQTGVTTVEIIKSKIRSSDIFARWGGEEFMLLLLRASLDVAAKRAELLRASFEGYDFIKPFRATGSFGVSTLREDDSMDSFIKRADEALYAAKRNSRNRVEKLEGVSFGCI